MSATGSVMRMRGQRRGKRMAGFAAPNSFRNESKKGTEQKGPSFVQPRSGFARKKGFTYAFGAVEHDRVLGYVRGHCGNCDRGDLPTAPHARRKRFARFAQSSGNGL